VFNKWFFVRFFVLICPIFFVWFFVISKPVVHAVVVLNQTWFNETYSNYDVGFKNTEKQGWRIQTNLFNASRPYSHNTYQPKIALNNVTHAELGDMTLFTMCLPLFWLLMLSYRLEFKKLALGTLYLFPLIAILVAFNLWYQMAQVLVGGDEYLRALKAGYVLIPERPPEWFLSVAKPIKDASVNFVVIGSPVFIWFAFYWGGFSRGVKSLESE
jgi:hypothetical protein